MKIVTFKLNQIGLLFKRILFYRNDDFSLTLTNYDL